MNGQGITLSIAFLKTWWRFLQLVSVIVISTSVATVQQSAATDLPTSTPQLTETALLAPPVTDKPLALETSFQLLAVNNINDKDETFEFVGIITLKWQDARLSFDPIQAGVTEKIYQGDYQINEVFTGWSPLLVLVNQSGSFESSAALLRIRADGTITLSQMINAVAEVKLSMRRLPFDHQNLEAEFGIFGFDQSRVVLNVDPVQAVPLKNNVSIDQWSLTSTEFSTRELPPSAAGDGIPSSTFVVSMHVQRDSFFIFRLVIFPLALIVVLTWSVFWMDRASMGDRINICFVGILTAVAYQIVLGDRLPQISYMTFINGFLNISFLMMCATVVVNLAIGVLDSSGQAARANLIEQRSRWIFPTTYFGLVLLALGASFVLF